MHPALGGASEGFWPGPSVLDHATPAMSCYTNEIFGPLLNVLRAPSYEAAVDLVNKSTYGNGVAVFTNDGRAARKFISARQGRHLLLAGPEPRRRQPRLPGQPVTAST